MAEGENQPDPDEWHPTTKKDYEDIMAGGIIRARELEEAEKARKAAENGGDNDGSSGSSGPNDKPPNGRDRKRRNFLGG